ncbi:MAG: HEXXH motif domain-containing protein [Frankia sp.]|nr:HEXXH motif domain-containing protein [Frankia sp.]
MPPDEAPSGAAPPDEAPSGAAPAGEALDGAGARGPELVPHRVTLAELDALAAGEAAVPTLPAAQLSKRMLLIRALVEAAASRVPALADRAGLAEAAAVLRRAHHQVRSAVNDLLLHPQLGTWGMRCLRELSSDAIGPAGADATDPAAAELASQVGYFGSVAAAAALRAGQDCAVTGYAPGGALMLPTLGLAQVAPLAGWVRIEVRFLAPGSGQASVTVRPAGGSGGHPVVRLRLDVASRQALADGPPWLPLRRLVTESGGRRLVVDLDDIDPFRNFHHAPATSRLTGAELTEWQSRLEEGWRILVTWHPRRAEAIAPALLSLVPLAGGFGAGQELSASSADAYGAVALTLPHSGLAMAASLVHELAHSRLSALLDLVPLFVPERRTCYYSPWRRDPRPVPGLIQGAYAFLTLIDFWNVHRASADDVGARLAHFEYARWRAGLGGVLDSIVRSGTLTAPGHRFLAGMRARLAVISADEVPAWAEELARGANADHRITWRLTNVRPDPVALDQLLAAWSAGGRCPRLTPPPGGDDLRAGTPQFTTHARLSLALLRLREPDRFRRLAGEPGALAAAVAGASAADVALLTGDPATAGAGYADLIRKEPENLDPWVGLALARQAIHGDADPVVARPELAYALHAAVRGLGRPDPDPLELADWLATAPAD